MTTKPGKKVAPTLDPCCVIKRHDKSPATMAFSLATRFRRVSFSLFFFFFLFSGKLTRPVKTHSGARLANSRERARSLKIHRIGLREFDCRAPGSVKSIADFAERAVQKSPPKQPQI